MPQITWTKCSERIPPEDTELILRDIDGCLVIRIYSITPSAQEYLLKKFQFAWCKYTTEAWEELSR